MGDGSENYCDNEDEEEENELPQIPLNLSGPQEVNVDNSQVKIGNTVNVNFSVGNIVVKSENPDQLLQGCSTQLPGNDLNRIIGEIVAQKIHSYLQEKSLGAIAYNEMSTQQHNQSFQKEDNRCGESNSPVIYEKSASIGSSHECKIQEIDDSKTKDSELIKAAKSGHKIYIGSSLIMPPSLCLPENHNPGINYFESKIQEMDSLVSSGSKQTDEPQACLLIHKPLPSLSSSSLPENNHPKIHYFESKIREPDDSEASCRTQIFSKSSEAQTCHLKSKTLSPSKCPGNNNRGTNYFESKVREIDESEASCSNQILDTTNYKQIYNNNQTCLLKQYSVPQFSVTSSERGEDIEEGRQNGVSKVFFLVDEFNEHLLSTSQTSLLKSLISFDLQNLVINIFAIEVCNHFKENMIPYELDNFKINFHIFITYIVKVFEVICKGGKLKSVGHTGMTRVTDFEKDNHGLSFNIEFSFKELIISFDNCYLHFLPKLKKVRRLYNNYEPVKKNLEIFINECLIKTHFIITKDSKETGRILDTNVNFLDSLVIKITSEDIDRNQDNKIGELYFESYLQTHTKILKNIVLAMFSMSVNYVAGIVNTSIFNHIIQNVFN